MKRYRLVFGLWAVLCAVCATWAIVAQEAAEELAVDEGPEEATDIQVPTYVDADMYVQQAIRAMNDRHYGRAFKAFREVLNRWPDLMFKRDTNLYYGIPRFARRMIMSIPREELTTLGIEEESAARRLLGRARESFEPDPLRTIRDKYFWTRSGAPALELLGDIQMERDQAAEAVHAYYQLLEEYRLDEADRLRVGRKLVAVLSSRNDQLFLLRVLREISPLGPDAMMSDGRELVKAGEYLKRLETATGGLLSGDPEGWSEPGGSPARVGMAPTAGEIDVRKWVREIAPLTEKKARNLNAGAGGPAGVQLHARIRPGMPQTVGAASPVTGDEFENYVVVARDRVMYIEGDRVVALDVHTGNMLWEVGNPFVDRSQQQAQPGRPGYNPHQRMPSRPSHTLAVRGSVLFALRPDRDRFEVLMIDIETGKRLGKAPSRSFQPGFLNVNSLASGMLPYGGRVYMAYTTTQGGGNHYSAGFVNEHLVAIDMQDPREPRLLWDTLLYGASQMPYHHNQQGGGAFDAVHLPTVGGNALFYNSDDGAVVSLDAMTGETRWIYTYEKHVPVRNMGRRTAPTRQPPETCYTAYPVYYDNKLICVPSKAWDYFALDASSGELLWHYPRNQLNFLVGVRAGIAYLTGKRIEARDLASGKLVWEKTLSNMEPGGKGLLAGNTLYVPMRETSPRGNRDRILRLDAESGQELEPIHLDPKEHELGNLVMAGGTLLSINAYRISAFCAWDDQYELLMARLAEDANDASTLFHLGGMYARKQNYERAIEIYKQALAHVKPGQDYQDQALGDVLKDRLYGFYRDKTRKEYEQKQFDVALATAGENLQYAVTPEQNVETRFTRAMLEEQLKRFDRAALEYQQVKKSHPRVTYQDKADSEIAAGVFATVQIDRLVKQYGQEAYALVEKEARALVDGPESEKWELVVQEFGPSAARRDALLKLSDLYYGKDDAKRGARYLKRFVVAYPDDGRAPESAVKAVQSFEKTGNYYEAGSLLKRIARDMAGMVARVDDKAVKLGEFATARLEQDVYQKIFALPGGRIFTVDLPLKRAWDTGQQQNQFKYRGLTQPFELDGQSMVATMLLSPNRLVVREVNAGKLKWERGFGGNVRNPYFRFAPDGEQVLVVDQNGKVDCIDTRTGKLQWETGPVRNLKLQGGGRIVTTHATGVAFSDEVVALSFRSQQVVGGRQQNHSVAIVAYKRDGGKLAWMAYAEGGHSGYVFQPNQDNIVAVDGKLVTATQRYGNTKGALYVFDMSNGKLKAKHDLGTNGARQIYRIDDERVVLAGVNNGNEVALFNVVEDKILWKSASKVAHSGHTSELIAVGELVLFRSTQGVHAFKVDDGQTAWFKNTYQANRFQVFEAVADPTGIYMMYYNVQDNFDIRVDKLAAEGGKLLWSQKLPRNSLSLCMGQSQDYLFVPVVAAKPRNNQPMRQIWNAQYGETTLLVMDKEAGTTALKMNVGDYKDGNRPNFHNQQTPLDVTVSEDTVFVDLQGKLVGLRSGK